jgi:hypothetical protein
VAGEEAPAEVVRAVDLPRNIRDAKEELEREAWNEWEPSGWEDIEPSPILDFFMPNRYRE